MCNEDEETFDNAPPTSERVARRALILAAMTCRASVDAPDEDNRDVVERLLLWFDTLDLGDELHPAEAELIRTPYGQIPTARRNGETWNAEGLMVLAWALNRFDLLPHDRDVDPIEVTESVDLLYDDAGLLISSSSLRSLDERNALHEVLYATHVRLVQARRSNTPVDFRRYIEPSWFSQIGLPLKLSVEGDLLVDGVPVFEVSAERRRTVERTVGERHRASTWLVGEERVYYTTTADT